MTEDPILFQWSPQKKADPRDYKSLIQAASLRRIGGMAGLHRIYLGLPSGYVMLLLLILSFVNIWLIAEYGEAAIPYLKGAFHHGMQQEDSGRALGEAWLLLSPCLWIVLKVRSWLDGINLPSMVYEANTGSMEIINPVTPTSGL
jgi:hypothetical protein